MKKNPEYRKIKTGRKKIKLKKTKQNRNLWKNKIRFGE